VEGYVWMWFEGDEEDLRALEGIFGPQPFVRRVLRPDGSAVIRGKARLWSVDWLEQREREGRVVDLEKAEAVVAWVNGEGEVALMRRCREMGLDARRALEIYRALQGMTVEEAREWLEKEKAQGD